MFELEQAIGEWRQKMLAAGVKSPVPLEELESHLRDDIATRIQSGVPASEAFTAADRQIGQAHALKNEFAKVDGIKQSLQRKLVWAAIGITFVACWFAFHGSPGLALAYGVLLAGL